MPVCCTFDCFGQLRGKTDSEADGDSYRDANTDTCANSESYPDRDTNPETNGDAHANCDPNCHADFHDILSPSDRLFGVFLH